MLQKVATELGLQLTGWDVDTNDWKSPRGLAQSQKCEPARKHWKALHTKWGRPLDLLMHVNQATARDLKDFILGLEAEGWEFRTYGDPPQQRPSVSVA
jgi:peptidoglycan/xylan/chitin deacetylase (PgdA/CDA1 family)